MLLEQGADKQVGEDVVMHCVATLFGGGSDSVRFDLLLIRRQFRPISLLVN